MSFWPKCAPNISFFASFTSVPSQEKIPITETEGHFGPNRSYQIGSVWFWDCFFANDIVFCNLYCFCAGYWLHVVSLERRDCSELLFAKIRTIWDCYFVWDCVFLQLRLFFTRPLLQKGSSLQEEILSVDLSICLSVITFSFFEYSMIWWFRPWPCKLYIFWKLILLEPITALFWPSTAE